jgi:hypothetical protein
MNEMEQPINQTLLMEEECEELHNTGVESNNISTNRSTEKSVSQISDNGSINLGKFKDAESLLKAYNSLQTEFTKKSQRLSELENSKTDFAREGKINEAINELTQNHAIAQKFAQQIKEAVKDKDVENYSQTVKEELLKNLEQNYKSASDLIADPQFLNDYIYTNSTIRENIIRDYLSNLTNIAPTRVMSNISSSIPVSPPNIPTTIQEAGKLAKNIVKKI